MTTSPRKLAAPLTAAVTATLAALIVVPPAGAQTPPAPARPTPTQLQVGSNPNAIAVSHRLGQAFVANDGSVSVVSLTSHQQLTEFGTGGYHGQDAITLVRHDNRGYVTNFDTKNLVEFNTHTDAVTDTVKVGTGASDIVTGKSPRGQVAYVGYLGRSHLTVVSTRSGTVTGKVRLPAGVQTLTTRPDGRRVWAGSTDPGKIYVVDPATDRVVRTVNAEKSGPITSIAFAPGGKRAWVAGLAGVSVIDRSTGRTVRFFPILRLFSSPGPNMGGVVLARHGRYALVENSTFPDEPRHGQVTAIDTRTGRIAWRVRTGVEPTSLALDHARNVAYTTDYADDTLTWFRVTR